MPALQIEEQSDQMEGYAQPGSNQSTIAVNGLSLCNISYRVTANGVRILLRPIEFRLLEFMMCNADRVYTRAELLAYVWGRKMFVGERTVDVHIRRIRSSLEPFGMDVWIRTLHTRGYYFSTQH